MPFLAKALLLVVVPACCAGLARAQLSPAALAIDSLVITAARWPQAPSELIDARIAEVDDWRGEMLSRIRGLTKQAVPDVVEEIKWRKPSNPSGVPVWSHEGIIFTGEPFKGKVKLTFAKGASLEDPAGLFNSSLEAKVSRAIDLHEEDDIDEEAFRSLVRAAAELNAS